MDTKWKDNSTPSGVMTGASVPTSSPLLHIVVCATTWPTEVNIGALMCIIFNQLCVTATRCMLHTLTQYQGPFAMTVMQQRLADAWHNW